MIGASMDGSDGFLTRMSRRLFYVGLFASSLLALRLGPFTVGDFLIVGSALLMCLEAGRRVKPIGIALPVVAFGIVMAGLLSAYRSVDQPEVFVTLARLLYLVCVLPWQARNLLPDRARLMVASGWWAAGAAVCSAGTLLQYRFGPGIIPGGTVTNAGRFSGFAQSVSDTGAIASVGLIFAIVGLRRGNSRRIRTLSLLCVGLALVGLVLSGSVSGILAAGIGVIYLILRGSIRPGLAVFLAALASAALVVALNVQQGTGVALTPMERIQQTLGLSARDASLNTSATRLDTMRIGVDGILHNPIFGAGIDGQSGVVIGDLQVHNIFLAAFYQGGALLCLALLIAVTGPWRRLFVRRPVPLFQMQANAVFLTALVFAMTGPSFYNRYFWIPVALSYVAATVKRDEGPTDDQPILPASKDNAPVPGLAS
ncbi:O-antigen ligase family protein [Curtobacterium sp. MCSS17_015]|uniref:O-antigen ligase family protein n=1 Tax=Curtobacterium sp. MCSS17_015 TaxID=2175666 RepID=UPI0011B6DB70|nr:O-antigen ligase family protein [Curtobacterium sp. MCSS17_015]WIB25444.1 O-antigen ligase family protein [Curtobacterium sp. MCSS17_015]